MSFLLKGLKDYSYVILFVLVLGFAFYLLPSALASEESYAENLPIIVQRGDTLWGISEKHHKDVGMSIQDYLSKIQSLNQLESAIIYPGQELFIITAAK